MVEFLIIKIIKKFNHPNFEYLVEYLFLGMISKYIFFTKEDLEFEIPFFIHFFWPCPGTSAPSIRLIPVLVHANAAQGAKLHGRRCWFRT